MLPVRVIVAALVVVCTSAAPPPVSDEVKALRRMIEEVNELRDDIYDVKEFMEVTSKSHVSHNY